MQIENFNLTTEHKKNKSGRITSLIVILCLVSIQCLSIDKLSFLSVPFLLAVIAILVINIMMKREKIVVFAGHWWLILCFFMIMLSALVSVDFSISLQYAFYYTLFGVILILLSNKTEWYDICLKTQFVLSMINAIVTILSSIFPTAYYALVLPLYTDANRKLIVYWMKINNFPGIAGQIGTNSFLITLGIAIILANIWGQKAKKGKIQILFLLIMLYALFLSGKRGLLIGNSIAALVTWYVGPLSLKRTRLFKIFSALVVMAGILYISSGFIPILEHTLSRFWNNSDISSGRLTLFTDALQLFKEHYLMGAGINAYTLLSAGGIDTSMGAHNDLLQIMVETGIIGTIIYFAPIVWILKRTFKAIRSSYRYQYDEKFYKYRRFLLASLYIQIVILFYAMIGNPFHYYNMLFMYMIFAAIPIGIELAFKRKEHNR